MRLEIRLPQLLPSRKRELENSALQQLGIWSHQGCMHARRRTLGTAG